MANKSKKPIRLPAEVKNKIDRVFWTIAALSYGLEPQEPKEADYVTYGDRMQQIANTGKRLSAFLEVEGPHGADRCDPYITIDNVCEKMVDKFRKKHTYCLTNKEIKDCAEWHGWH